MTAVTIQRSIILAFFQRWTFFERLRAAVDDLLAKGSHDFGALAILCEQRRTKPRRILPVELGAHVVDRDVVPHDLGGYDDNGK